MGWEGSVFHGQESSGSGMFEEILVGRNGCGYELVPIERFAAGFQGAFGLEPDVIRGGSEGINNRQEQDRNEQAEENLPEESALP